ncbi:GNAT family N-acetyltransferase [Pseudomonas sp.]|uniref:GNAT family N-acetyltransferase n=1 Tax=Pseudomonas sp. TaxID=306 RepID=UPI0031DAFE46
MQPTLITEGLRLRPLDCSDAAKIERLLQDREIARMTANIPHPYTLAMATAWIERQPRQWQAQEAVVWGIERQADAMLMGVVSLRQLKGPSPVLGYWLGKCFWGKGHASRAASLVCQYARGRLGIESVVASRLHRNVASGKVLERAGFKIEGFGFEQLPNKGAYEAVVYHRCRLGDWR